MWCQLTIYLANLSSFLSVYYIVAFTVERFIVVMFPLRRRTICTVRRAKIVCVILGVFALLFYSFSLWMNGVRPSSDGNTCMILPQYTQYSHILMNVDTVLTLVVPSVPIITLNSLIAIKLYRTNKNRRNLPSRTCYRVGVRSKSNISIGTNTASELSSHSGLTSIEMRPCTRRSRANGTVRRVNGGRSTSGMQMKTTRLLLIISTVFIVLNIPSHAFRLHLFIDSLYSDNDDDELSFSYTFFNWQQVCQLIYYVNFSINFFFYSAFAQGFANGLRQLGTRLKKKLLPFRRVVSCYDNRNEIQLEEHEECDIPAESACDERDSEHISIVEPECLYKEQETSGC